MYAYKYPAYRFEIDEIADVSYAKDGTYTVAEYPVLNRYGYAQDNADVTITVVGPDNQNVSLDAENTFTVSRSGEIYYHLFCRGERSGGRRDCGNDDPTPAFG